MDLKWDDTNDFMHIFNPARLSHLKNQQRKEKIYGISGKNKVELIIITVYGFGIAHSREKTHTMCLVVSVEQLRRGTQRGPCVHFSYQNTIDVHYLHSSRRRTEGTEFHLSKYLNWGETIILTHLLNLRWETTEELL